MELSQEYLKEIFDYKDGFLYWKVKQAFRVSIGDKVGWLNKGHHGGERYLLKIKNKTYYLSRIIFLWHHGYLPDEVDHKDRNQVNNKIENLRAATRCQNNRNSTSRKNSTSQYLGVHLLTCKSNYTNKKGEVKVFINTYWRANVNIDFKVVHVGVFKTEEEAALAYNRAAVRNYCEFANLNILQKKIGAR